MPVFVENLVDVMDETCEVPVTVSASGNCVVIEAVGYGDKVSQEGLGVPVIIELHNGDLRVVVWADINQEDPTHIISLANAKESKRVN